MDVPQSEKHNQLLKKLPMGSGKIYGIPMQSSQMGVVRHSGIFISHKSASGVVPDLILAASHKSRRAIMDYKLQVLPRPLFELPCRFFFTAPIVGC